MKKKNLFLSGLAIVLLMSNGAGYVKSNAQAVIQPIENFNTLNDLVVGNSYSSFTLVPYMHNLSNELVTGKKYQTGKTDSKKIVANGVEYNEPAYSYCIFKMGIVDVPYQSDSKGYFNEGDSYTLTLSSSTSTSYEEGIENTLKAGISSTINGEESFILGKIGYGINSSIESSVKTTEKYSTSISNTESETFHYNIKQDGYYCYQRRVAATMYIIASYENNYRLVKKGTGYQNVISNYTYLGYNVYYKYSSDLGTRLTRYTLNDEGKLVFADKISNTTLLGCL